MLKNLESRMDKSIDALMHDFSTLRAGKPSADILNPVMVEAYGSKTPISQVATINVPDVRTITISVWDRSMVGAVDKAIRDSGLGFSPVSDGQSMRIIMPELSQERRAELVKVARKYAENARVAIRNVRRDGMDDVKKAEKSGDMSEDEMHSTSDQIQKITDKFIKKIDDSLAVKEKDVMTV